MSASRTARVSAGVPTGGQFAATSHSDQTGVALGDGPEHRHPMPSWGTELEDRITTTLDAWTEELRDGDQTLTLAALVNAEDHDALVSAYGEHRAQWLEKTTVRAQVRTMSGRGNRWQEPELYRDGSLYLENGDDRLSYTAFGGRAEDPAIDVLAHCPAAPGPADQPTEQRRTKDNVSAIHEVRDPQGRLTDGPDGTPAIKRFGYRGRLDSETSIVRDALGNEVRIDRERGSTVTTTRTDRDGALIDGPDGEPARQTVQRDGSGIQTFHGQGRRTATFPGHADFDFDIDPPAGGLTQIHRERDGRSMINRGRPATPADRYVNPGGLAGLTDGPGGSPAVEYRRVDGSVSSRTWMQRGYWTTTTDYTPDGSIAVEFHNR